MRAIGGKWQPNLGPGAALPFSLYGGMYQLAVVGFTSGGNAALYQTGPDGTTAMSVVKPFTANGGVIVYLPPGTYFWIVNIETNLSTSVVRVPLD